MNTEMVSVVDENDIIIATKPRSELEPSDIVRVSVLWIENSKGEVLLQQRSLTKKYGPGQWSPAVAGTVEAHETYLANVIKEAEEEIGLTDFTPIEVGKRIRIETAGSHYGRMFTFYKAFIPADVKNNPSKYVASAPFWQEMYY